MKLLVTFVIFAMILWYFNIDIRGFVDSHPQVKYSFEVVTNFLAALWKNYLASAAAYIWNDIILDVVWKNLALLIEKLKA